MISVKDRTLRPFFSSARYWQHRYKSGRTSGAGSRGANAEYKAAFINDFIRSHRIETAIEFGFGDGVQLEMCEYPDYLGFEVSRTAIQQRRKQFRGNANRRFKHLSDYAGETADLTVSLDVVYHLVEQAAYEDHLTKLFDASNHCVLIFSTSFDCTAPSARHAKHRNCLAWIEENRPDWRQIRTEATQVDRPDTSADFFVFERPVAVAGRAIPQHEEPCGLRILVADDDAGVRSSLHALFTISGYDVTTVASCAEAADVLASEPIDIFVCDYNFGSHTAESIAGDGHLNSVPSSILLSASENVPSAVTERFTHCLHKSGDSNSLLRVISDTEGGLRRKQSGL